MSGARDIRRGDLPERAPANDNARREGSGRPAPGKIALETPLERLERLSGARGRESQVSSEKVPLETPLERLERLSDARREASRSVREKTSDFTMTMEEQLAYVQKLNRMALVPEERDAAKRLGEGAKRAARDFERRADEALAAPATEVPTRAADRRGLETVLDGLAPEVAAMAMKNYQEADEGAHGGIGVKGIMPDGTVRLAYKDGTIEEVLPGGQRRTNRPDAEGAAEIAALAPHERTAAPVEQARGTEILSNEDLRAIENGSLLTLEDDLAANLDALSALKTGAQSAEVKMRTEKTTAYVRAIEDALRRKRTPAGYEKEMGSLRHAIAETEADLNLAPEEERGVFAHMIDSMREQLAMLERRRAALAPGTPRAERRDDDEVEPMTLEDDPRFQELFEEKSLDLLLAEYRGFADKYALHPAADGTVTTRDGISTGKEPSEFLTQGDAEVVRAQAKEIFASRHPEDAEAYAQEPEDRDRPMAA